MHAAGGGDTAPARVVAWVEGGGPVRHAEYRAAGHGNASWSISSSFVERVDAVHIASAAGGLRVRLPGAAASTSCTWTARDITLQQTWSRDYRNASGLVVDSTTIATAAPPARAHIAVSPGCPVGAEVLPVELWYDAGGRFDAVWSDDTRADRWYQASMPAGGEVLSESRRRANRNGGNHSTVHRRTTRFDGTLRAGEPVSFTVP